jgi:hypothetical protein
MTVVVAFLCTDGIVVAADSMITPSVGNINVGHHKGRKIGVLAGPQVYAFAGDQGQAARFSLLAGANAANIGNFANALEYPIALTQALITQFQATGIAGSISVNTVLAFAHGGSCHCCVFEGAMQPRLLDPHHFYVALGTGKLSADPFLRYLSDIFCNGNQPRVRDAIFLATWTVQHVIDTNPGGVAGPIRITTFIPEGNCFLTRELPDTEIDEHRPAGLTLSEIGLRNCSPAMPPTFLIRLPLQQARIEKTGSAHRLWGRC